MSKAWCVLCCVFLLTGPAAVFCAAQTRSSEQTASAPTGSADQPAQKVPVIDGGAGPCSLDLTVTNSDGKPVYAATVKVHIAYRFGGFHKLDLEASTNVNGKVNFIGLPSRVRRPPLQFEASKGELVGTAEYDPESECQAKHNVILGTPKPALAQ